MLALCFADTPPAMGLRCAIWLPAAHHGTASSSRLGVGGDPHDSSPSLPWKTYTPSKSM